jgi:RTX calcium-binding nonapeptide repeat (4 copies)
LGRNPTWGGGAASIIYADAGNDTIFGDDQTDTYQFMGETAVTGSANAWGRLGRQPLAWQRRYDQP